MIQNLLLILLVQGGWGKWKIVSVNHCITDPNGKVKLIRFCNHPTPQFGGSLCPDPEYNERFVNCNETNYNGK